MKPNKKLLVIGILLMLITCLSGATGASILTKSSQIINLFAVSDASGIIPLSSFQQLMPDGASKSFTIPSSKVLLVTRIDFVIATKYDVPIAQFQLTPFYSKKFAISGGFGNQVVTIKSGFPLSTVTDKFMAKVISLSNNSTIQGTLECRLVGILAPKNTAIPINILLDD